MISFQDAIELVRKKYFLFEEFPVVPKERFPQNCLRQAAEVDEAHIADYAFGLKGRQLEALMHGLTEAQDWRQVKRAVDILCIRRSQRLAKLIGFLAQYHYNSPSVSYLCERFTRACVEGQIKEESFLWRFGAEKDKIAAFENAIAGEGQDMEAASRKYGVSENSPMAIAGFLSYFNRCDKTAFLINYKKVIALMKKLPVSVVFNMIANYLKALNLVEYDDNVNTAISEKLGQPYISAEWEAFPTALRDKFAQWSYLNRLKIHCEGRPEKFRILVNYFEHVRTNYALSDGHILITDFGWLILVDVKGSNESYLYEKKLFDKEMDAWDNDENALPSFFSTKQDILTARQFMLSTLDAPCIKLSYEDIEYYISEVLDIKLGIEPDMRSLKLK